MVKKRKIYVIALLSVLMSLVCIFGIRTLIPKAVTAETTAVTAMEMTNNREKLLPKFNHTGKERIAVSNEGVIYNWGDGNLFYQEEVYAVSLQLQVTSGQDMAFALRTTGNGAMWDVKGYYAYVSGTTVELIKISEDNVDHWREDIVVSGSYGCNLFDGALHTVAFSAVENDEAGVVVSFSVDGNAAVSYMDTDAVLPIENTAFKIVAINEPIVQVKIYGGMPVSLYESTVLSDAEIKVASWNFVPRNQMYIDKEIYGYKATFTLTGDNMGFALRASGLGAMWTQTGYFAYVAGTSVQIYKVDGNGDWNDEPLGSKDTLVNIFDGNEHTVTFTAIEKTTGVEISYQVDAAEALVVEDTGTALSIASTKATITQVNPITNTTEYGVLNVSSVSLISAAGAETPLSEAELKLATSIESEHHQFVVDAEAKGITVDATFTVGNEVAYGLRTSALGAMWDVKGYYAYVGKTSELSQYEVHLYKVPEDGMGSDWNGTLLARQLLLEDIFDRYEHTVTFTAIENAEGQVELTFSVGGRIMASAIDTEEPLPITDTKATIVQLNEDIHVDVRAAWMHTTAEYETVDTDTMIDSGLLYSGIQDGDAAIEKCYSDENNPVVRSWDNGGLVYKSDAVEQVQIDVRITKGESLFMAMRATGGGAVWEGGFGYFFMFNDLDGKTEVQLVKGLNEMWENPEDPDKPYKFDMLTSRTLQKDLFAGERHVYKLTVVNRKENEAYISLSVDGTNAFAFVDKGEIPALAGSHFLICTAESETGNTLTKLYGETGEDPNVEIPVWNISLKGVLDLNFYAKKEQADEYLDTQFVIENENKTFTKIDVADALVETVNGVEYYKIPAPIFPKEYKTEMRAYVRTHTGYDYAESSTHSIYEYLDVTQNTELGTMIESNAALGNMVQATLDYCEAARIYFEEENENFDLTVYKEFFDDIDSKYAASGVNLDEYALTANAENTNAKPADIGVKKLQFNLILNSGTELRLYVHFTDEASALAATCNGETLVKDMLRPTENVYYYSVTDIKAVDLNKAFTFTVANGDKKIALDISTLSYVKTNLSSQNANLVNVIKALTLYSIAADAYFTSEG